MTLLAGLFSSSALARPDYARHGASCHACHVSPTGGGALTPYGRLNAGTDLATWGSETLAQPLYGLARFLPDGPKATGKGAMPLLAVGGDQRLVRLAYAPDGEPATFRTIPMQYDVELAVTPTEALTVAATWGVYGEDFQEGSRRHYVLARAGEHLTARVGRFFPGYGLMEPDHTRYNRKVLGFNEGTETVNGELGLDVAHVQLLATAIYGQRATFAAQGERGYDTDSDDEQGAAVRVQALVRQGHMVGASCLALQSYETARRACGLHAVVSLTSWLWSKSSYDALLTERDYVVSDSLSVEPVRGITIALDAEATSTKRRGGLTFQWFPIPHVELQLTGRREQTALGFTNSVVAMGHHYL